MFGDEYFEAFRRAYSERRDFLVGVLQDAGLKVAIPRGAYFILADFTDLFEGDDRAFARFLIEKHRVAAIPPSAFYKDRVDEGQRLIRFAFCKRMETLKAAAANLAGLRR